MSTQLLRYAGVAALAAALCGCNLTGATVAPDPMPSGVAPKDDFKPSSDAGEAVNPSPDAARLTKLVATRQAAGSYGQARSDPFALTTPERYFETEQLGERLFAGSGFSVMITPKPDTTEEVTPPEEQPYRRLSGVVVGDSVLAILEEGGTSTIITPGMQIPNSPWRVVSIDQDKAVLKRSGNVKPTQIIVRLETPRFGEPTGGAMGGGPQGGPPPGSGYPGGPPSGFPGGPSGGRGAPGGRGGGD